MMAKILVVDDEADYRHLVRLALESEHFEVHEAENGAAALDRIPALKPDLIILDISMPGIDGYTVCNNVRKNPLFRTVPIIMLTVLKNPTSQVKGLNSGSDHYMIKPFEPDELIARVKTMLKKSVLSKEK
jgi:DNA-binding response OmpR family regulator